MKVFHCDHCGQLVFFENTSCLNCGHVLAYVADFSDMCSLEPLDNGLWRSLPRNGGESTWRLCENYSAGNICNWALAENDPNSLCVSCRLTHVIPNLSLPKNKDAWCRLETAKRRLLYTLLDLGLPLTGKADNPEGGVAFLFLADEDSQDGPVLSGHENGVITINIAEADDAERERRRNDLHEPYRTILGHFRHEIGHYYWDRLIPDSDRLPAFRELFGDESQDYGQALNRHYEQGPPADYQQRFVSAYASAHPWEDWAETWAHYLHMSDALQTAASTGLVLRPRDSAEPTVSHAMLRQGGEGLFERMVEAWFPLTYVINNLNRGLGLPDGYPFVLSPLMIDKLRFIHETIAHAADSKKADGLGQSP
ncbi:MAG: putative zinc-binding peptidase [Planctomycetota bacterium]